MSHPKQLHMTVKTIHFHYFKLATIPTNIKMQGKKVVGNEPSSSLSKSSFFTMLYTLPRMDVEIYSLYILAGSFLLDEPFHLGLFES